MPLPPAGPWCTGPFGVAFDPHEGALGCETPGAVPEEGVARIGGVSSKDMASGDLAEESLAVGEDCAREVEMT